MTRPDHERRPDRENQARSAKQALERVCSGAEPEAAAQYYSPCLIDHVNDLEFHGHEGAMQSVDVYKSSLSELSIAVEAQVIEGDFVTSRFVVTGSSYGRPVLFQGITISRFDQGMIIEDWSVTDTLGLLRQLGWWRACLLALRSGRKLKASSKLPAQAPSQHRRPRGRTLANIGERKDSLSEVDASAVESALQGVDRDT